jgi:hypothetical protein
MLALWQWQDNMIALEGSVGDVLADGGSNCCILCAKLASNSTILFALDNMVRLCVYFVVLIVCMCVCFLLFICAFYFKESEKDVYSVWLSVLLDVTG